MKVYVQPSPSDWPQILARPTFDLLPLFDRVGKILQDIQREGDEALRHYTRQFDQVDIEHLQVTEAEVREAEGHLSTDLKAAIQQARTNIERFHAQQNHIERPIETMPGVCCWRKNVAIEKVGLYVPGGTAPLFSSVLMLGVPAKIAGCRQIVLCSPPGDSGRLHPAILYTADLIGISTIIKAGGVQAIGAMAYGTETVPQVYKIFGPGNQYVTAAKQLVSQQGTAIDMPAGPSEVLVCADKTSNPAFVAADLLSQAEHGIDSQVVLVAFQEDTVRLVQQAIEQQLADLPRAAIARKALENSVAVIVSDRQRAADVINAYAPEHLILSLSEANDFARAIVNAGSVFIGPYTPESVGDYASGTNHTLPTNGYARAYSGVSLESFVRKITYQELTADGLRRLGPTVELMAETEALQAHRNAVRIRLESLKD